MGRSRYEFRSTWQISAPPETVYAALERLPDYPLWWPQVRSVRPSTGLAYELVVRSSLPYSLRFTTTLAVHDPVNRVIEATLSGDLHGFSRWTVSADPTGTVATFEEEVTADKPLLRRLTPIARPAFTANHARMMQVGERGLRTYLDGLRPSRSRA